MTYILAFDNIKKYPETYNELILQNHSIGNHTFDHLNGWKTSAEEYIDNVLNAEEEIMKWSKVESPMSEDEINPNSPISDQPSTLSKLFRPPYGKLSSRQSQILRQKGYNIIMWDVLSGDFDASISEENCFSNVSECIKPRSIVVFHDSLKAGKKLRYVLPKVLELISEKGWNCEKI